jgi:hydrophobic/amphiphilic exporter-1 (mainly G- bacteria), HAE1 family
VGLTRLAVRRPLFITMAFLAIVVFGVVSYQRLGVNLLPAVDFPVVTVVTAYPGASPDSVESLVTIPIEDALSGLSNLDYITSTSVEGVSSVVVVFNERADSNAAAIDVERKVNSIRAVLPADAVAPTIVKADINVLPVLNLSLSGPQSSRELTLLAEDRIVPRLKTVDGVASVSIVGGRSREIQVRIKPDRLRAYGLSVQQVSAALGQENLSVPAGQLRDAREEVSVRLNALAATPGQLGGIVLLSGPSGTVYLRDVADIEDTTTRLIQVSRSSGKDSIGLLVTKQGTANTIAVADGVKEALAALQSELPAGAGIDVVTDASVFTRSSLLGVQRELGEAILLVGIVLLLFLHSWRSTAIVLLAIPTSIVATFVMMAIFGLSLNTMSLLGLTLTIGALVDDSIVVLENIFRQLELGETPLTAAIKGRSEIGVAAIAITLVDVVVFAPIAFLSGITGQFFREFGLVIVSAVLFSLLVSFTLTPMLASRWLRPPKPDSPSLLARFGRAWDAGSGRLAAAYRVLLGWSLRHRWPVIGLGVASFALGMALVPLGFVGSEFVPEADQAEFTISAEMPPGTPLGVTDRALQVVEARLAEWPEVERTFTSVGAAGEFRPQQSRFGRIVVKLVPVSERTRSAQELATAARLLEAEVPSLRLRAQTPALAGGGGQPVQLQVRGSDVAVLSALAREVQSIVRSVPGTRDVTGSGLDGQPEVVFRLDRDRAADLGVSATSAAGALRTALTGSVVTQYRQEGSRSVDVRVLLGDGNIEQLDEILGLPIATARGTIVQLGQVVSSEQIAGAPQIDRRDRERLILVSADLEGRTLGEVTAEIEKRLQGLTIPAGYSVQLGGVGQEQRESFTALFQALGLSVLLTYMVTVALYESWLTPFVILFSLPLAAVGAIGALALTGSTLNLLSLIGFILLTGLVGKNAILLLDYTNTLRKQGVSRNEALLRAGPIRLRPILMTALSLIIALTPVALGAGEGAEIRRPIAIPVIGGMITSTLLTLVFIPALYTVVDDLQQRVYRLFDRQPRIVLAGPQAEGGLVPVSVADSEASKNGGRQRQ